MKNIRLLICCALSVSALFCNSVAQGQTISTIAGGAAPGMGFPVPLPAEGVPATAATTWISSPYGIVQHGTDLFIADENDYLIRKVDASGNITLVAGIGVVFPTPATNGDGGLATAAFVNAPVDVATDNAGNIYIAENTGDRVRMINALTGIITTIAGTGTEGAPYGDGGPATAAHINPRGIVAGTTGDTIYVSDGYTMGGTTNYRVRVLIGSPTTGIYTISTYAGTGTAGVAPYGDGGLATAANLDASRGLFLDGSGNLYIADMSHNRIRTVNAATGIISTVAGAGAAGYGGDGGPATAAAARLDLPTDVVVDAAGDIYIADATGNRVRYVDHATGNLSTIVNTAGTAGTSPYGDGGSATAANLSAPVSLVLDGTTGNYYISDQTHNRIRYVNVSGVATAPPTFTGGSPQTLTVCENSGAANINSLLQAAETTTGLTLTWSNASGILPLHGTLVAAYTTTSTGSAITPTGLTYTPNTGYSGLDSFKVQVSNGTSNAATTVHVTVNPLPVTAAIAGATSTVCVGSSITFTDATTGGAWVAANTNAGVVGGTVTGAVAGTDDIYYIVTNTCGSDTATALVTINPTGAPTVSISSTLGTSACGVAGTFTASPVGGGAAPAYQWSVNGATVTGATSDTYTYTPAPGDIVSVQLTSSSSCASPSTATGSITMTAGVAIVPTISITTGIGDTVCVGVPVTFTSTITNGGSSPSYNWTINGIPSGTGSTFVYIASPTSAGDIVECTLTSSIPCASPSSAISNDVVIQLRSASSASLSIAALPGDIVCAGTHVTFTATETGGGGSPLLRWTRAGVNVATGPSYTTIPDDGDVVYCTMHSSIACSASDTEVSNLIGMTVNAVVVPAVTVTSSKIAAAVGEYITFTATVTSATLSPGYQWYVNGVAVPGATTATFIYADSTTGTAVVNCAVSSGDACNAIGVSNIVSITVSAAGVKQLGAASSELKLIPNPNKGVFTMNLQSGSNEPVTVIVTNILGEKVKEFTTTTNTDNEISLDEPTGVYLLSATTDSGRYVARIVIN